MTNIQGKTHTITALKRWCCNDPDLPAVSRISELHVYDFDNTLFNSPMPNRALWDTACASRLQNPDVFVNGGWWHDASILSATGDGIEVEEPRAWEGHWNEKVVELVRMSLAQQDALTVLLTGRGEKRFADLVQRICRSKRLDFDMYCLKPAVGPSNQSFNTMTFKQEFLSTLMRTYNAAKDLRLYEDRVRHIDEFRLFFDEFNRQMHDDNDQRGSIDAQVIEVKENAGTLDPVQEAAAIQNAINFHNQAILAGTANPRLKPLLLERSVLFAAYQVKAPQQIKKLQSLFKLPNGIKPLGNNIMITTFPPNEEIMKRAGGVGASYRFKVVSIGHVENRIWAAQLQSLGRHAFSMTGRLQVVLGVGHGVKPAEIRNIRNWKPLSDEEAFQFNATVGEFFRLSIKEELPPSENLESGYKSTHNSSVPQKRRANDSTDEYMPEAMDIDTSQQNHPPPTHHGSANRARGTNRRGDARTGRGGGQSRGSGVRGRGRGQASHQHDSRKYTDHDAQSKNQVQSDAGVYTNY